MAYIPPTLEGWVYIMPIHVPLDGPLYTRAQYTPTDIIIFLKCARELHINILRRRYYMILLSRL